jgi:ribosomal protein S18 acetylase RimI-like enzyme
MEMTIQALAAAADANFVVHATWAAQHVAGMRTVIRANLALVDSGLACDTFNIACCARLAAAEAPQHIQAALDFFAKGSGQFSWWVGPADQPPRLGELLQASGLARADGELAMAASWTDLSLAARLPDGLEIQRVANVEQLEAFALTITHDAEALRFYQMAAHVLLQPSAPQWFYLGYVHDEPVATVEVTIGGGAAGLYNITTLERYRGRGIGTAITSYALQEARLNGISLAVLQAAAAGVGVYRRLGFEAFGEIVEYKPVLSAA